MTRIQQSMTKVAIIGAGAAGLCSARHLAAEKARFVFDVYEQQEDVGGTWKFSNQIGKDEFGLPVHSSMYKNLRTNLPKEVMAFPDFLFHHCDGKSFIHHTEVLKYLKSYAKHYNLYEYIKFHTIVENVEPVIKSSGEVEWSVSSRNLITDERNTHIYDAVMVCNGHYSVPDIPELDGLETFKGIVMHSHDYRDNKKFRNLRVVVLGAGASGIDIAVEVSWVAKEIVLSHNNPPKEHPLPANAIQSKGIESIGISTVTFIGGTTFECDAIILCTGYQYTYPFFHPKCNVTVRDRVVSPLYKHLFHRKFPTLAIWSVPKIILPFVIYDQQVKLFVKFLNGQVQLPSEEEMTHDAEEEFRRRIQFGLKPEHYHVMVGKFHWEYDDQLCEVGNIPPVPKAIRDLFTHVGAVRKVDVLNYKDVNYRIIDENTFTEI